MKSIHLFYILCCLISSFLLQSCEKSEIQQTTTSKDILPIDPRGGCDDCPDLCCCFIELTNGDDDAQLFLCGASDGTIPCTATLPCLGTAFDAFGHLWTFSTGSPRYHFCMNDGYAFEITNKSNIDVANVKVSCQRGQTNAQTVTLQIQPEAKVIYKTNSSCEVVPCP